MELSVLYRRQSFYHTTIRSLAAALNSGSAEAPTNAENTDRGGRAVCPTTELQPSYDCTNIPTQISSNLTPKNVGADSKGVERRKARQTQARTHARTNTYFENIVYCVKYDQGRYVDNESSLFADQSIDQPIDRPTNQLNQPAGTSNSRTLQKYPSYSECTGCAKKTSS